MYLGLTRFSATDNGHCSLQGDLSHSCHLTSGIGHSCLASEGAAGFVHVSGPDRLHWKQREMPTSEEKEGGWGKVWVQNLGQG